MHHGDGGYDVHDPALTPQQRALVEFPESWFNRPTQPKNPGRATGDLYANNAMTRLHTAAGACSRDASSHYWLCFFGSRGGWKR